MKPRDIQRNILPRLIPLWIVGLILVFVLAGMIWAVSSHLLPESWSGWVDLRFTFGYALAATAAPVLLVDAWILMSRHRRALHAEEAQSWVRSGYDAVNDEMPYHQPISEAEKKTNALRDYFSIQMIFRWCVFYFVAVLALVLSLSSSFWLLQSGTVLLSAFLKPVLVTAGLSIFVIVLAAICQLCNAQLWATWERQVMALQAENPRYVYMDSGEPEQDKAAVDVDDEEEDEIDIKIVTDEEEEKKEEVQGGWQWEQPADTGQQPGEDSAPKPPASPQPSAKPGGWGTSNGQSWGGGSAGSGGWGQSNGGYNV